MSARTNVVALVLGSGAAWEPEVLRLLDGRTGVVVLKRCVDVDDLVATAASGQADVAVVAADAPGLDVVVVDQLRAHDVRPVLVASTAGLEATRSQATRLGIGGVVAADQLDTLPDVLLATEPAARPESAVPAADRVREPVGAAGEVPQPAGRVIAVWGATGAPGRTTVAVGLAAALAAAGEPTVLVDADPYGGAVAQSLGILDEVSGLLTASRLVGSGALADAYTSWVRLAADGLGVVTGLPRADRWAEVRSGTVEAVLEVARQRGHVVVDTGFCLEDDPAADFGARPGRNQLTRAALTAADAVVVVGSADPVGLARLARVTVELRDQVAVGPTYVVVNRMRASLGWSAAEVETMVASFVGPAGLHFLPDDRVATDRALVAGRAVGEVAADTPLARELAALAHILVPAAAPPDQRSRFRLRRAAPGRRP